MISSELYEQIVRFINDEISVRELEDWYVPRLVYYLRSPFPGDSDAISAIELALAERTAGILDDEEVKACLSDVIRGAAIVNLWSVADMASTGKIRVHTSFSLSGKLVRDAPFVGVINMTDREVVPAIKVG